MNKRGFTLTELIATITLIAIITSISVVTFQSVTKKTSAKQKENLLISLKADAKKYIADKKTDSVNVETLINTGYTDADKTVNGIKVIIDPSPDNKSFPYLNCYIYDTNSDSFTPGSYNINSITCN